MACSLDENSYCVGPECEIFDPINTDCQIVNCSKYTQNKKDERKFIK
jgi:hypothetical protein